MLLFNLSFSCCWKLRDRNILTNVLRGILIAYKDILFEMEIKIVAS